jgi:hypothetical protein
MLYLVPPALSLLSIAILWFALPYAGKFRQPSRYRTGVVLIALGCTLLWVVPVCVHLAIDDVQLRNFLMMVTLVIPLGMIGGGANTIGKANNTPNDDTWDNILGS